MRRQKAFLAASVVLLLLGISAWQCGGLAQTPTPAPPAPTPTPTPAPPTPTPTPSIDWAVREYVRKTGTIMMRFTETLEAWDQTLGQIETGEMSVEEWLLTVADVAEGFVDLLHDLQVDWSLIEPPPVVQDLHSALADCFDEMTSAAQRTHDAAAKGDVEPTWNAALDFIDVLDMCEPLFLEWDEIYDQAYRE